MRLTRILVRTPDGEATADRAALMVDAIWAAARPEDRVEHVSAEVGSNALAIGVFTRGGDPEPVVVGVRRLMARVAGMSAVARHWTVVDARGVPLGGPGGG